jgi:very-short-patch-repair endonuclease
LWERGKDNPRDFARKLRKTMTDVERAMWKELRAHRFGHLKFKRQQPLGNYVVDFVCLEKGIVVELDGGQHAESIAYDKARDDWQRGQGFQILRFWNNEVLSNKEGVLMVIADACGLDGLLYPLSPSPSPTRGEG